MNDTGSGDFYDGAQPTCDLCGTVMRTVDGGYACGGCGYEIDIPWIERPGQRRRPA